MAVLTPQEVEVAALDVRTSLSHYGFAPSGSLLKVDQCEPLRESYVNPKLFRSRIEMSRFRFGRGEYKYFARPLPKVVTRLRGVSPIHSGERFTLGIIFHDGE